MNQESLLQRRNELGNRFNALRGTTDDLRAKVENNERELLSIKGAYDEVDRLMASLPEEAEKIDHVLPPLDKKEPIHANKK